MSLEHEPLTVVPFDPLQLESHAISLSMTNLNIYAETHPRSIEGGVLRCARHRSW